MAKALGVMTTKAHEITETELENEVYVFVQRYIGNILFPIDRDMKMKFQNIRGVEATNEEFKKAINSLVIGGVLKIECDVFPDLNCVHAVLRIRRD